MGETSGQLRYLLLQVRKPDDPVREQEVACFARALGCDEQRIGVFDLLTGAPTARELSAVDVVLLGGSGDYSVAQGGAWLDGAMDAMRTLYDLGKPTFASCWGFQAMARALGGEVVTDLTRAELGTHAVHLTAAGKYDPVFGELAPSFLAPMGHQDIVDRLPEAAVRLASSQRVANQAFHLPGKPIYCTQFHSELDLASLVERIRRYPWYAERIAGVSVDDVIRRCQETPQSNKLLPRFVKHVFG